MHLNKNSILNYGKRLTVSLAAMVAISCGGSTQPSSNLNDASVNASATKKLNELGYGYSEKTGKFLNTQCVTGTTVVKNQPDTGGKVEFIYDASYEDVVDSLAGSLDVSLNLAAIKASAGAELAKKTARTALTTNVYAYVNLIGKSELMKAEGRGYGPTVLIPGADKEAYCGTDFISQIDYGASMAVSFEVTAKTHQQREKIAGYLKVNFASIIEGSGSLESIDQSENKDYKVRLMIKQVGGVPQNVSLAIPDDGIFCDVSDIKKCVDKMNIALDYMRTQMRSDLADIKNWNPITYHTTSYALTADLRKLAPQKLTEQERTMLTMAHNLIKSQYETTMADWKDADLMASSDLLPAERNSIIGIREKIITNSGILNEAINACQRDFKYCMGVASNPASLGLAEYDPEFRTIAYARQAKKYCQTLIQAAFVSGELGNDEARSLALEASAPVFADPKNSSSPVIGFSPCFDIYELELSN
ncbi:MAG: hypothetical protein EOP04_03090 [Proteobacteria bacterium]|nr:MAG: hypothetical protein EOP04_03090 [Pseudomonadota bacterium]